MKIICDSEKQEKSIIEKLTVSNCPCDYDLGEEYGLYKEKCTLNCEECWKGKIETEVKN